MPTPRRLFAGAAALLAGCAALAALSDVRAAPPSDKEFTALVEAEIKYIQKRLAEPKAEKAVGSLRSTAILVAHAAQGRMADAKDAAALGALRDAFVALDKALSKKDLAGATKLAKELTATPAGEGKPGEKVDFTSVNEFDLHTLMKPFTATAAGGRGFEKANRDYAKKLPAGPEPALTARRMEHIAELTALFPPADDEGKKTKEAWLKWSGEMKKAAGDASVNLAKGKAGEKAASAAFKKLDAACTSCHNVFRE